MFHAGLAAELAATFTHDRIASVIPPDERSARALDRARSARAFEQALSLGGAASLLVLAVLGPAAALIGVAAITLAIAARGSRSAARIFDRTRPVLPAGDPADRQDRWRSWRVAEPDPEHLRRGAA